ncbi:M56 family metallopeptidase [Kitasatospora sp. NPDC057223]|uniref:M56 family metallopeptidase n=1 Tax=Kitasatospora sp. NPDC057223 TaxID=3346055 RepID=UPI003639F774
MNIAVWVPLLLPLLAVAPARLLADALPPRAAAWVLAGTAAVLAGATLCSLGLLAAAGLLRLPPVAALGHLSPHWLAAATPGAALPAALAALALTVSAVLGGRVARGRSRDLRRAREALGDPAPEPFDPLAALRGLLAPGDHPLAVLADDRADAFALPGRPGRVVVTAGMLRALSAPERAALLAHERAHLSGRHHVFLTAAAYAAAVHPALRLLRTPLGYHLERWADEAAAVSVGDRTVTARAVGRAALAASRAPWPARPRLVPAAHSGPVPRRVAALLHPRPQSGTRRRSAAALALAACLALTTAAALDATSDLHRTVESAQTSQFTPTFTPAFTPTGGANH